jgi:hypothetical protein
MSVRAVFIGAKACQKISHIPALSPIDYTKA